MSREGCAVTIPMNKNALLPHGLPYSDAEINTLISLDNSRADYCSSRNCYIQDRLYCFAKAFGIDGLQHTFTFQTLLDDDAMQKAIDGLKQVLHLIEHQPADVAIIFEGQLYIREIQQASQFDDKELENWGSEDGNNFYELLKFVRYHIVELERIKQAGEFLFYWVPDLEDYTYNMDEELHLLYPKSLLVNIEILTEEGKALIDSPFPKPPKDHLSAGEAADWYRQTLERLPSLIPATATPSQAQATMQQLKRQAFALALSTRRGPDHYFVSRFPEDWKEITGEKYYIDAPNQC